MNLYPAIDILGGNAVRLVKGDFDAKKVYDQDPLSAARRWRDEGATRLHVVDLDGAKAGRPENLDHLQLICDELGLPIQYGGGLRTGEAISQALAAGAERVILGTAAFTDPELLETALREHGPERIVVSVDVRAGSVVIDGWTRPADVDIREVFAGLIAQGVRELAYTNVDRDGMLEGVSTDGLVWVAKAAEGGRLIYSGGIGSIDDLRHLAMLRSEHALSNLDGVIVGKALYERRFTIAEAQRALRNAPAG